MAPTLKAVVPACGLVLSAVSCSPSAPERAAAAETPATFQYHGVVEGFYGRPWSHEDRLEVLQFMGSVGLNSYFYAPKNDPYHRERWRDPYPPAESNRLRELVTTAQQNDVAFWYAISPGLTMVYSDSADYQALLDKIDAVRALGVEDFGLFLDDVPAVLSHPPDRQAYGTLAEAHIHLINQLRVDLEQRGSRLAVTPTTYTDAWGDRDYAVSLGKEVHQSVPLLWTGTDVVSPQLTFHEAGAWAEVLSRDPLIWDNFPVNDFARWRLFLGPLTGRTADLAAASIGLLSNPMNEAHASMIPLSTLADFVRSPEGYDPRGSLRDALQSLYGAEAAGALQPFVDFYGDGAYDTNVFEPLHFLGDTIDLAPIASAIEALQSALAELRNLESTGSQPLEPLIRDITPFASQPQVRLAELENDSRYERRGNLLVFRQSLDSYRADGGSADVDGNLSEWASRSWHDLGGPSSSLAAPRAAFASDGVYLFIAIEVSSGAMTLRQGNRVGEGDHIALVLSHDLASTHISPRDLLVLLPLPDGSAREIAAPITASLRFDGFMSKYLADNRALTFNEFHLTTFGEEPSPEMRGVAEGLLYDARATAGGYVVEVGIPLEGNEQLKFSLTVTRTAGRKRVYSLASRDYPANPRTFSKVKLGR